MILRVPRRLSVENEDDGSDGTSEPDRDEVLENNTENLEPWVDWIRRTIHEAERRMKSSDWMTGCHSIESVNGDGPRKLQLHAFPAGVSML